jgi:hypothetical protein
MNTKTEPWFTDSRNFWSFRTIFHPSGLDYVPDRGGFRDRTPARLEFIRGVTTAKEFKLWVSHQDPASQDLYNVNVEGLHFRATCNASYGYCYLWAWEDVCENSAPKPA